MISAITKRTGLTAEHTLLQARLWLFMTGIATDPSHEQPINMAWHTLCQEALELPCAPSTRLKIIGTTIGAMKRNLIFAHIFQSTPLPFHDRPPTFVYDQLRVLKNLHRVGQDLDLPEITPTQMWGIAKNLSPSARLYLVLLYLTAQRSTSILQLLCKDVKYIHSTNVPNHQVISLRFRSGKTNAITNTYSVHCLLSNELNLQLQTLLQQHKSTQYLFGPGRRTISREVSTALLSAGHSIRACRRGSLRFLARQGASTEDLLLLSRHTNTPALYHYLGGGIHLKLEAQRTVELSRLLLRSIE
jgi:hypothetical protein